MIIGNKIFKDKTYIMAIINLTPDSFWEESRVDEYTVLKAAEKAVNEGADILDIGAQSTRPNYEEVSAECEIKRLYKPLFKIKQNFDIPISVDTYFPQVAEMALQNGADMINDISGLTHDGMAETISKHGASVCIMHNAPEVIEGDIWENILPFLKSKIDLALGAGINREKIIVDGGIGFAKTKDLNFELLNSYEKLKSLGYPLLLGASRKSMFGGRVEDRLSKTLESTRLAVQKGVLIVRVHDVAENAKVIREEYGD